MDTQKYLDGLNKLKDELNDLSSQAKKEASEVDNKIKIQQNDIDNLLRTQKTMNSNVDNSKVYFQNTLSTTQFFEGSLANDVFNQAGNTVPWYYKTFARKVRGLNMQGASAYQQSANVLNTNNNTQSLNPENGTGVGWGMDGSNKLNQLMGQKWWAWWVVQLATIQKFTGLVTFECEDKKLLVQLYRAYQLAIVAGHALIRKQDDKYAIYFAYNVEYDEFNEPIKATKSSATWFFNNGSIPNDDEDKEVDLTSDEYILLTWDINHYNIWFYTVFYTIDYIDLLYIWLNRTFISRAIIFQEVGSQGASKEEALQLMNPINTVIQIRTSGLEAAEHQSMISSTRTNELEIANKYKYLQLGDSQADSIFSAFPKIWMNIWDSILGLIPPNNKLDAARSISDEIEPNETINQILQKKYGLSLDLFIDELKAKWQVEVKYTLAFEQQEKKDELENNANPAFKKESGNENEQQSINSLSNDQ